MIFQETSLFSIDNSGLRRALCITRKRPFASITDIVLVSVKRAVPNKKVKKGEKIQGIIGQQTKPILRLNNFKVKFKTNSLILLKKGKDLLPLANRAYKKVALELRYKHFMRIILITKGLV